LEASPEEESGEGPLGATVSLWVSPWVVVSFAVDVFEVEFSGELKLSPGVEAFEVGLPVEVEESLAALLSPAVAPFEFGLSVDVEELLAALLSPAVAPFEFGLSVDVEELLAALLSPGVAPFEFGLSVDVEDSPDVVVVPPLEVEFSVEVEESPGTEPFEVGLSEEVEESVGVVASLGVEALGVEGAVAVRVLLEDEWPSAERATLRVSPEEKTSTAAKARRGRACRLRRNAVTNFLICVTC
jgi:hypothetical protein